MNKAGYSYQDFWKLRGTQSFWMTIHFGYRPGAAVAWLAAQLRIPPNAVSYTSFVIAGMALVPLWLGDWPRVAEGLWLGFFLLAAYWLDCADGVLARVTGRSSSFGAALDKTMDMAVAVMTAGVVAILARDTQSWWLPATWQAPAVLVSLAPRAALTSLNWLKDAQLHQTSRVRPFEAPRSFFGKAKRIAGNLCDDVTWRLGVGGSWALGCYWEFALLFGLMIFVMFLVYMVTSKRDFDAFDEQRRVAK